MKKLLYLGIAALALAACDKGGYYYEADSDFKDGGAGYAASDGGGIAAPGEGEGNGQGSGQAGNPTWRLPWVIIRWKSSMSSSSDSSTSIFHKFFVPLPKFLSR